MKTELRIHDLFDQAYNQRDSHPLPSGIYKLRETIRHLEKIQTMIEQASEFVRDKDRDKKRNMVFGSTDDAGAWIKGVPDRIATLLGHDVLPAIVALTGDGLPEEKIEALKNIYHRRIADLLDRTQFVKDSLDLRREYRQDGQTPLRWLLEDLITMTQSLLRDAEQLSPSERFTWGKSVIH